MLIKIGEFNLSYPSVKDTDNRTMDDFSSEELERFEKLAETSRKIAPKAKEFLYFTAVMMHAAEAALLNPDGSLKKDANGKEITASFEHKGDSIRWVCSDSTIKPFKNANGDIFPSSELLLAHKKWVGKPLCQDHQSSSPDFVRGLIVDTLYDTKRHRVIALCALDRKLYPELARKVQTGVSASVSMGTAVGRAICTECGQVARVEADFCRHMKDRTCYGEINLDLNPIELSIVVNGADPHAKIRQVFASANGIRQHIDMSEAQLNKLADAAGEAKDVEIAKEVSEGIDKITEELSSLKKQVEELKSREQTELDQEKTEETHSADNQDSTFERTVETTQDGDTTVQKTVENKKLASVMVDIQNRFNKFQKDFKKYSEEQKMTVKNSYWQGGGGVSEPTPNTPKYPKEDSDTIRDNQDKQMVGQRPFPSTGPVDGMHPGVESAGESEAARKKRLQRMAEAQEQRRLLREAAVTKAKESLSYWQGGGGVSEPTPGKPKYPKEDSDTIRDKEDKQMQGQSPFPGVGKVDGLHPSPESADEKDELKRKQMLSRAEEVRARFYRSANDQGVESKGDGRWMVFAGKNVLLDATVKEITGNRPELFDAVATKEYGTSLLSMVKREGAAKAKLLIKGAQSMPESPAVPAPSGTSAMPLEAPPPAGPPGLEGDMGGSGDVSEELPELMDKAEKTLTEIRKGVNVLMDKDDNKLEVTEGMSPATAKLVNMKEKIAAGLLASFKESEKNLTTLLTEGKTAGKILERKAELNQADKTHLNKLMTETVSDLNTVVADAQELMGDFLKYARGTEMVVKRANKELETMKTAQFTPSGLPGDPLDPTLPGDSGATKAQPVHPAEHKPVPAPAHKPVAPPKKDELPVPYGERHELENMLTNVSGHGHKPSPAMPVHPGAPMQADDGCDGDKKEDENDAVKVNTDGSMTADSPDEAGKAMKAMKAASKEERAALRAKLAEKGVMMSDLLQKAHPKGGADIQLDVKPSGDLGHVEDLKEQQEKDLKVVQAPVKVRKAAEDLYKLVVEGTITEDKFPMLIEAGLDPEAVKYYKQFFAQAPEGGSQFAADLVKDVAKKKAAEDNGIFRAKLTRAYEVAYQMEKKGMHEGSRESLRKQVDELMSFNDEAFKSMERWVERQPGKTASLPLVGYGDLFGNETPAPQGNINSLKAELDMAFSTPRKRR